jgi:hypothetical protein
MKIQCLISGDLEQFEAGIQEPLKELEALIPILADSD